MSRYRIAHRYAEALLSTAEEEKQTENVIRDLRFLHELIKTSREFILFLKSPVVKREKKLQVIDSICGKYVQPLVMQFLQLLIDKGRSEFLEEIIKEFFSLYDERRNIVTAEVRTASEWDAKQQAELKKRLSDIVRKEVQLEFKRDEKIIGGFIALIGDTVFDGSIRHQLEILRQKLLEESVS